MMRIPNFLEKNIVVKNDYILIKFVESDDSAKLMTPNKTRESVSRGVVIAKNCPPSDLIENNVLFLTHMAIETKLIPEKHAFIPKSSILVEWNERKRRNIESK